MTIKNKLAKILSATLLLASTNQFAAQKSFGGQESLYYLLNYGPEKYQRFKNYRGYTEQNGDVLWCKQNLGGGSYVWYAKYHFNGWLKRNKPEVIEAFTGNARVHTMQPYAYLLDINFDTKFKNTDYEKEVWCEPCENNQRDFDGLNGNEFPCGNSGTEDPKCEAP